MLCILNLPLKNAEYGEKSAVSDFTHKKEEGGMPSDLPNVETVTRSL